MPRFVVQGFRGPLYISVHQRRKKYYFCLVFEATYVFSGDLATFGLPAGVSFASDREHAGPASS
jgi:hypothetical protein